VPIYGYRCSNCGHEFEIQQRMSDEPLKVCPKCQGKLTKILYPAGVIFKGSGFYTTDYKGSSKSSGNGSSSDGKATETKTESKTESKPETKSESKADSGD
jgi:putative FmdB family regulatory protein